jgi:DNA-binding transcriptional ArsR family regulator
MVQYKEIDRTFAALADPTRRAVVERLGRDGVATVSELAEPAGISLTGMKKHLRVLEEAGLVQSEKVGRTRQCRLGPNRADDLATWIDDYRKMVEQRYDRLDALLARRKGEEHGD